MDLANNYDMSFLYSRESECIGEGVPLSDNKLAGLYASVPTKSELARKRGHVGEDDCDPKEFTDVSVDAYQRTISMQVRRKSYGKQHPQRRTGTPKGALAPPLFALYEHTA